jgi:hypothetical protein
MFNRIAFILIIASSVGACSGSGGGTTSLDTTGGADVVAGDAADAAGVDAVAGEDTTAPADTAVSPEGVTAAWLHDACEDWCALQDACGDGILDLAVCAADCMDGAADAAFLATVACGALGYEEGDVDCAVIELCAAPLAPDACLGFCGTVAACGILGEETAEYFGTTETECALMCGGYGTLAPGGQFDAALECLAPHAEACDLMEMLGCIGGAGVCDSLCGPEGPTEACGLVPGHWADEAACFETCGGWGSGQAIAVQVCIDQVAEASDPQGDSPFGDQGECAVVAAARCMNPPASLGAGAESACENLADLCGDTGPFPEVMASEACGWFVTGFLMAAPPGLFLDDFTAAAECIAGLETCDDAAWIGCFLAPYEPAQQACAVLVGCLDEVELPPGESFDLDQCIFYLSIIHAQQPEVLEGALACIDAAEGCQAKFGCLGSDER